MSYKSEEEIKGTNFSLFAKCIAPTAEEVGHEPWPLTGDTSSHVIFGRVTPRVEPCKMRF